MKEELTENGFADLKTDDQVE
ncbi:MAG: hypothetical protein M3Z26_15525, partial [Bacteroidota bacterium]|nr:hypothetical protein [Bacteroidota bacterium]